MAKNEGLNLRQQKFVQFYLSNGHNASDAAKKAGYSCSNATVTGCQLLKSKKVQAAIAEAQKEIREKTRFGLEEAMGLADQSIAFAEEHENPMARVKAVELKCKLAGLLVERHEIKSSLDLSIVLRDADQRLIEVISKSEELPSSENEPEKILSRERMYMPKVMSDD